MKLFRSKDFWVIWFIGLTHNIMKWLEILAVGVVVFEITGSPFYVALMVIVRFIPLPFFGFLMDSSQRESIDEWPCFMCFYSCRFAVSDTLYPFITGY